MENFSGIIQLIQQARNNTLKAVNTELINLYWQVGEYISRQVANASWGDKTVDELALFIQTNHPELKGFNRRNLYRMKQFYEAYASSQIVSPLVTQIHLIENQSNIIVSPVVTQLSEIRNTPLSKISWTHHLLLLSRTNSLEEKEFYIKMCTVENYTKRQLDRQISSGLFERVMISNHQPAKPGATSSPDIAAAFKDTYVFEFLNLPDPHNEADLQKALIKQMKLFILELGKDFLFVGEEYKVMVGNSDFYIDLLFYHRGLQCLIAFELKADKFKPGYLGQLNFYLEALDRDVKKPNENPSIGIMLCKDKDHEVVEYAMSRNMSPALVSEYKTQLPDKKLLQRKLNELFSAALDAYADEKIEHE